MKKITLFSISLMFWGMYSNAMNSHEQHQRILLRYVATKTTESTDKDIAQQNDIPKSISYVYYPSSHECGRPGHASLEVNGKSWVSIARSEKTVHIQKDLDAMIEKTTTGDGQPFFRFIFKTTPEQQVTVSRNIKPENAGLTCSSAAIYPLKVANVCSVPSPLNISPLMTAAYLTCGKVLGLNNVEKIAYYGNPSRVNSILKMLKGPATELATVGLTIGVLASNICIASYLTNSDVCGVSSYI